MSKYAKRRSCPALGREITSAECGEKRISQYACPAECAFNPFSPANYEVLLELEAGLIRQGHDWYLKTAADRGEAEWELNQSIMKSLVERHAVQMTAMYDRRDASGRNCCERWEAAGYPGLKNDERVIQRAVTRVRVSLFEVHRVRDDRLVEGVDLLSDPPVPMLLCDRSLAAQACRFSTLLGFNYALPHYWRIMSFAMPITSIGGLGPRRVVEEVVRHLGGPASPAEWTPWFMGQFARFSEALDAVSLARWEQTVAGVDADFGKAVYELRAPFAKGRSVLDAERMVEPDDLSEGERNEGFAEARVWFDRPSAEAPPGDPKPVLGRVLLGQSHLRVEAIGQERMGRLRAAVEGALGDLVRFTGERRDDLSAHLKSRHPRYDPALVPPRLLEDSMKVSFQSQRAPATAPGEDPEAFLADLEARHERVWPDQAVPGLDGRTPREAAKDPALRPRLLQMLKDRVRGVDERNLQTGGTRDPGWLLRELGADELIFEPPPPRPPPENLSGEDFEDDPDEGDPFEELLDHWPPLPDRPFSEKEAVEHLTQVIADFDLVEDAKDALEEAGCFPLDELRDAVGPLLSDDEFSFMTPVLIRAWFAFVPPGCYGPEIETVEVFKALGDQLARLDREVSKKHATREDSGVWLLTEGAQPAMIAALASVLMVQYDTSPPKERPKREQLSLMLLVLRAFVEVLDKQCREDL